MEYAVFYIGYQHLLPFLLATFGAKNLAYACCGFLGTLILILFARRARRVHLQHEAVGMVSARLAIWYIWRYDLQVAIVWLTQTKIRAWFLRGGRLDDKENGDSAHATNVLELHTHLRTRADDPK